MMLMMLVMLIMLMTLMMLDAEAMHEEMLCWSMCACACASANADACAVRMHAEEREAESASRKCDKLVARPSLRNRGSGRTSALAARASWLLVPGGQRSSSV